MTDRGEMRVSDAQRREVAERLRGAHDEGMLDLSEFDERVTTVWQARTHAELARITADLPRQRRKVTHGIVFSGTAGGIAMKVLTTIWACVAAVAVTVWGVYALITGDSSPSWLWVVAPPAAVLLVLYVSGAGRPPRHR